MKRLLYLAVLLGFFVSLLSSSSVSQDCSSPPSSWGGSGARAYKTWCEACGGTFSNDHGISCTPGPDWGRRGSSRNSSSSDSSYDQEAERQRQGAERQRRLDEERERQRALEEQKRREEEEARRRQEEFERSKQQALRDMKGIAGELGLKGLDDNELGLKGIRSGASAAQLRDAPKSSSTAPNCNWGDRGTTVVDLRCLGIDPDKPIIMDPAVARGLPRVSPAQIDPATFKNANYNKGYAALMQAPFTVKQAFDAIAYFKAAQIQRPNDPLVRNGLLMAQTILKGRQQKERDQKAQAADLIELTYGAISSGRMSDAHVFIARARELDKDNVTIAFVESVLTAGAPRTASPDFNMRFAYEVVGNSLVSMSHHEFQTATVMLQVAHNYAPKDQFIGKFYESLEAFTGKAVEQSAVQQKSAGKTKSR